MTRSRRLPLCTLAAALGLALLGCAPADPAGTLFPLQAGHRWTYQVTTRLSDGDVTRETLVLRSLGQQSDPALPGGPAWRRRSEDGVDYWLRSDASGIYRVASKSDIDADPRPDKAPRFVLRAPYRVGTQWQVGTTAYLLKRRNDFPAEVSHTHPDLQMAFQIEAENESVQVPAGRFEHCLRVKGVVNLRLYADPVSGWRDIPLITTEWYCPDVGLVRVERSETTERMAYFIGGTRTLELESWQ